MFFFVVFARDGPHLLPRHPVVMINRGAAVFGEVKGYCHVLSLGRSLGEFESDQGERFETADESARVAQIHLGQVIADETMPAENLNGIV